MPASNSNIFGLRDRPAAKLKTPGRNSLARYERLAIVRLCNDRGVRPELVAATFQCSVATVLAVANVAVSEVADLAAGCAPIMPTGTSQP